MRRASLIIAMLALVGTACSKSNTYSSGSSSNPNSNPYANATQTESSTTPTPAALPTAITQPFNNGGTRNVGAVTTLTMQTSGFSFAPAILIGKPGEHLKLTITNAGSVHHNFTLAAQHINSDMEKPGTTITVNVVFPKSGSLQFHCEYHEASGMKGALQVAS